MIQYQLNEIETNKKDLIDYYCEDANKFNLNEFFTIFRTFSNNVDRSRRVIRHYIETLFYCFKFCWLLSVKDNKLRAINEDKIEKRKKELNEIRLSKSSQSNLLLLLLLLFKFDYFI